MANVTPLGFRVFTDAIIKGSSESHDKFKPSGSTGDVVLEGSQEQNLSYADDIDNDPILIPIYDLTGYFYIDGNSTGDVLGDVVMERSLMEDFGSVTSWRVSEVDPVIVSDVGVGNGLIGLSSGGKFHASGNKSIGMTRDVVLALGSQNNANSGKRIMREAGVTQASEVDMRGHSTKDEVHELEFEQISEITPERCPFFVHQFSSQEEGKFVVSDLVWGKVKSHPWWPGQIVDPSDASKLAMKCQKKDALLVAYFWDKTFAWCDESQLMPFFPNFLSFEKQVVSDTLRCAVKSALKEVCRRIDAGTLCSCLNAKSLFKVYPKIENAGMRQDFEYYTVDRGMVVNSFNPKGLLGFIRNLALEPVKGTTNKLLVVTSKYYIKSFHRWMTVMLKKQTKPFIVPTESVHLPENTVSSSDEPVPAIPLTQISPGTPFSTPFVNSSTEKLKRKRGRPKKTPVELEKVDTATVETSSDWGSKTNTRPRRNLSGKRCKMDSPTTPSDKGFSGPDNMQGPSYWSAVSLRLQADAKLVGSTAKRPVIIPIVERKSDECIPTALLLSFSNKFCKVPSDMEIIRIFSQYGALRGEMEKEEEGSQSQVKLVFKKRSDAEKAFGCLRMQSVFGPSLLSYRLVDLPSSEVTDSSEQDMVEVNGEDHGLLEEDRTEVPGELNPTTEVPGKLNPTMLLLSFSNKSGKIPSEMELIRMFSHHGPLKERGVEKELAGSTCQFRVAFKNHSGAQMAFTSLRKQNVFGPSLLSYRLVNLPVETKNRQDNVEAPKKEGHSYPKVPALKRKAVQLNNVMVDNTTDRFINKATGLASTVQNETVTDISVDPSSITHGNSDNGSVNVQNQKQGAVTGAVVTSVGPSSSVQSADLTEISINPPSSGGATELLVGLSCTIETCEILADPSSSMQGEVKTGGEILIVSSKCPGKIGGGDEMPIELLSTGEGNTTGVTPTVQLRAEDSEVCGRARMSSNLSSSRQEDAPMDPSDAGEKQEISQQNLDHSKAKKQALTLECSPSRSAISGYDTTPSFQKTSPIWKRLESLDLFNKTPQQPHFKKLDRYCQEMRDGMAIGLMVTYANLVDAVKKLSFDDDVAVIEQKRTCLEPLEENGFNVDLIKTRLNQILQIKADHAMSALKQAELEKELAKKESESMSMAGLIEKIRSDMAKLEEEINALTEQSRTLVAERDRLLDLTVGNGHEISRLKNELSIVNKLQRPAREEFAQVLSEPF